MGRDLEEGLKDSFILDTSAFLSVECVNLLSIIIKEFSIITTNAVLSELEEFTNHADTLGNIAKKVIGNKNQLILKNCEIKYQLHHVSKTDEELYNLALFHDIPLITDDLQLIHHTKNKITRAFSTALLTIFVDARMIPKQTALEKLEKMRTIRNWQDNIIYLSTKEELEKE